MYIYVRVCACMWMRKCAISCTGHAAHSQSKPQGYLMGHATHDVLSVVSQVRDVRSGECMARFCGQALTMAWNENLTSGTFLAQVSWPEPCPPLTIRSQSAHNPGLDFLQLAWVPADILLFNIYIYIPARVLIIFWC